MRLSLLDIERLGVPDDLPLLASLFPARPYALTIRPLTGTDIGGKGGRRGGADGAGRPWDRGSGEFTKINPAPAPVPDELPLDWRPLTLEPRLYSYLLWWEPLP